MSKWTIFSNHGHVLVCLARDSEARLRDVALDVGITERAVQKIVRDLQDGGMISVTKNGRRNRYRIHHKVSLRHNLEAGCTVKGLIKIVKKGPGPLALVEPETVDIFSASETKSELITVKPVKVVSEKPRRQRAQSVKVDPETKQRQQGSLF